MYERILGQTLNYSVTGGQVSVCTELKRSVTCCDESSWEFGCANIPLCNSGHMHKFEGDVGQSGLQYLFESSSKKEFMIFGKFLTKG